MLSLIPIPVSKGDSNSSSCPRLADVIVVVGGKTKTTARFGMECRKGLSVAVKLPLLFDWSFFTVAFFRD